MDGGSKKNTRELADLLSAFGDAVLGGRVLGYADVVGLWLNLGRVRLQLADAFARGMATVQSPDDLPREVYDAVEPVAERVDEAMFEGNAIRMESRVTRRPRMQP